MLEQVSELHSSLRLSPIPLCAWATSVYPSSIHGHVGCFPLLAAMCNAAVNMGVQDPWVFVSSVFFHRPQSLLSRTLKLSQTQ